MDRAFEVTSTYAQWQRRRRVLLGALGLGLLVTLLSRSFEALLASLAVFVLALLLTGARTHVSIGRDGIELRRLGSRRFRSFEGVDRAEAWAADGDLYTVRIIADQDWVDEELVVREREEGESGENIAAHARSLADAINEALASRRAHTTRIDRSALARDGEDELEWIRNLRALTRQEAGFRAAPPSVDALRAVLDDPTVAARDRIAAAIAIARTDRDRVRTAAQSTASPRLRIALESTLEDDDQSLADAIRRLEP